MKERTPEEWRSADEESRALDVEMLREELVSELQAINQFQEHSEMLEDAEAQDVVCRLMSEEKEHVAELVKLVLKLDPSQREKFQKLGL